MKETEKKIAKAAIALFKEKGYENTSITEICKKSGVTKGTFYYHFSGKDDITYAFYDGLFSEMGDVLPEILMIDNAKEQLWRMLEYSIDHTIALGPQVLKAFIISDIQRGMHFFSPYKCISSSKNTRNQHQIQLNLIKKGQKSKEIRNGDPEMMLHTFISALMGIAMDWASNGGAYDEKAELRKVFDTLF